MNKVSLPLDTLEEAVKLAILLNKTLYLKVAKIEWLEALNTYSVEVEYERYSDGMRVLGMFEMFQMMEAK